MSAPLIWLLIFLVLLFIITLPISPRITTYELTTRELSQEEIDEITMGRRNLVENILYTVCDAWEVSKEQLDVNISLLPESATLIDVIYQNTLLKVYVYWNTKKIVASVIKKSKKTTTTYSRTLSFKKTRYLEKVFAFLEQHADFVEEPKPVLTQEKIEKLSQAIESTIDAKIEEKLQNLINKLDEEEKDQ